MTYWRLRERSVPIGSHSQLQDQCHYFLNHLLGPSAEPYRAAGLHQNPELLVLGQTNFDQVALTQPNPNAMMPSTEVPDGTPVLAWHADYAVPAVDTDISRVLRASYEAFQWVQSQAEHFPILVKPLATSPEASADSARLTPKP